MSTCDHDQNSVNKTIKIFKNLGLIDQFSPGLPCKQWFSRPDATLRRKRNHCEQPLLFHRACASTWWIRQNVTSSAPRSLVWKQQFYNWIFCPFTGSLIVSFEITWYLTRKIVSHQKCLTSKGNSTLLPGNLLHMDITHAKPEARISSELRKHKTNSMYPWESMSWLQRALL